MTEQPTIKDILAVAMSAERTPEERLASLARLHDFLKDEDVALALGAAARDERTLAVRRVMLGEFLGVDLTRFTKKDAYIDLVYHFAVMEPESDLRMAAAWRLAGLTSADARIQGLLAETLLYDLSEDIQEACLAGLSALPQKSEATIGALITYGAQAPRRLRPLLLAIYGQMERPDCERGLLALLNPMEDIDIRRMILGQLAGFPALSAPVARRLADYLPQEPDAGLQQLIVEILFDAIQADAGTLQVILDQVRASPDKSAFLYAFRDRLVSFPVFIDGLQKLFADAGSTSLKLEILALLEPAESIPFFTAALADPSPWVRYRALKACERYIQKYSAEISTAAIALIPQERQASLRRELVGLLGKTGRKTPEAERFLVRWMAEEADPAIAEWVAAGLPKVALTDENRQDVLNAYLRVLKEPFYSDALKDAATTRLTAFSFQDHPDLAECLKALMVRATDIATVREYHAALRTLEPDAAKNIDLFRLLFLRFIGEYATEPLDTWLKEFRALAPSNEALRREIPYYAKLTGANWILDAADAADQKENVLRAILDSLEGDNYREAGQLLDEAYEHRTLRKRDLVELYLRLLNYHDQYPLLDRVVKIMEANNVCSPEALDAGFKFLSAFPDGNASYGIMGYLESVGPADASYADRVMGAITQESYGRFCRASTSPRDQSRVPHYWDDSGWWRLIYPDWPLEKLFMALDPQGRIREILAAPLDPTVSSLESLQYLLLWRVFQTNKINVGSMAAIGKLMRNAKATPGYESLYERAVFVFVRCWQDLLEKLEKGPVPEDLAAYAADAFAEHCRLWHSSWDKDPEKVPIPLPGLDLKGLEKALAGEPVVWDAIWSAYRAYVGDLKPLRERSRQKNEHIGPQLYIDCRSADEVIKFLMLTPVPNEPAWEERWKALLKAANEIHGRSVARLSSEIPAAQRARRLSFLG